MILQTIISCCPSMFWLLCVLYNPEDKATSDALDYILPNNLFKKGTSNYIVYAVDAIHLQSAHHTILLCSP